MSDYIIDTSIVIQRLIKDTHTNYVRELFRTLTKQGTLCIPEFCLLECTNVLWKHVRFQGMPAPTAESLTGDLTKLPLTIYLVAEYLPRALEIGLKHNLAVYDALYIALAEKLGYPLITDDVKQEKAAQTEGIVLKPITDFVP